MKRFCNILLLIVLSIVLGGCDSIFTDENGAPVVVDETELTFSLIGSNEITIEVNTDYVELGALAKVEEIEGIEYTIEGTVISNVVGVYDLSYMVEGFSESLIRTINVVDSTPPLIVMDTVKLLAGEYSDESWLDYVDSITDNYSENITVEVDSSAIRYDEIGTYEVTIKATDESDNESTATFSVIMFEIALLINGDSIIEHEVHSDYIDLGATAMDTNSNPFVVNVETVGLDTAVLGTYNVTYTVDGYDSLSVSRTIHVVDTTAPVLEIDLDQTIEDDDEDIDWSTRYESVTDNYDTEIVVTEIEDNVVYGTYGTYTVLLEAVDASGNESEVTINITIPDNSILVLSELPDEEISIDFWHVYGQSKAALLDQMIAEFELEYPNITVESTAQGSYPDLLSKTKNAIDTGMTPDVVIGYSEHLVEYLELDGILPLDDFINHETWGIDLDDFIDSYLAENQQFATEMYSLPYSKSTEVLIYNKTLFAANGYEFESNVAPTWEEIEAMADTMVGTGENQCEFLINYDSSANLFITSSRQWDAGYTNVEGEVLVDNAETKAMLNYFKGLADANILALPLEWEQSYGSENFLAQDVCMIVASSASMKYNDPSLNLPLSEQFYVGVLPAPQFEGKNLSAIQQGPNIAIMENSSDAERLASWLFITFLTNTENTARWAIDTGYLPVNTSGYNSDAYQAFLNNPGVYSIVESEAANAAYAQIAYNNYELAFAGIVSSSKVREEAGYTFESIYVGTKTVEEAIQAMVYQLTW